MKTRTPQTPAKVPRRFFRVTPGQTVRLLPGGPRVRCGAICVLAAFSAAKAVEIEPVGFLRPHGPGRYSDRTMTVALDVDRNSARVIAYALKDRPFSYAETLPAGTLRSGGDAVEFEVALLGPDDRRFTRTVEVRGLCLDHDTGADSHVAGDTIRLHRETFLVNLPFLPGFEQVEIAGPLRGDGSNVRKRLGSQRLTRDLLVTVGGKESWSGRDFGSASGSAPDFSPETTGAVHWPSEYGDPDIYESYSDEETVPRIHIVIVPDGYRYAEKALLQANAWALVNRFRATTPYKEHDPFLTYTLVYAYSSESGTDQCDCGVVKDTAMNTRFPGFANTCGAVQNRCLFYGPPNNWGPICDPTSSTANIVAAELRAPGHDKTIIMVNSNRFGGCGGDRAVYSGFAPDVGIHEMGHSLAGLGDEYVLYGACGTSSYGINTSRNSQVGNWPEWIADIGPPVEGGAYYSHCLYRPEGGCAMQITGYPFCRVCQQQWALNFFGYPTIYGFYPISSVSPEGDVRTQVGLPASFSVETRLAVGPNVTNEINWQISGPGYPDPTTVATQTSTHTRSFAMPGTYALTCDIVADTNFIKPERAGVNHSYNTWFIDAVPVPEVSGPLDPQIVVLKKGSDCFIRFADTGSANYNLYVSNAANTHPFRVASPALGKTECGLTGLIPVAGGMNELRGYDLGSGLTEPAKVLYFLVTADNKAGTEGPLGNDSAGVARTADAYCNR